jgi:fluoride exporter
MRRIVLVFAGGFCGTLARYLLSAPLIALASLVLPIRPGSFPYDILLINLSGAFALGLLYGLVEHGARISPDVRLAAGTGFLGAFTTFSAFVYGGDRLLAAGAVTTGAIYLGGSMLLGVSAAYLGFILAGLVGQRRTSHLRRLVLARRAWHWMSTATTSIGKTATAARDERRDRQSLRGPLGTNPGRHAHRDISSSRNMRTLASQIEERRAEQEVG